MTAKLIQGPKQSLRNNRILAALTPSEHSRLVDDLEIVTLTAGQVLYRPDDIISHAYFPTNCIASLVSTTGSSESTALVMTGNDGLLGFPLVLGADTAMYEVALQSSGSAYRLPAEVLRWELDQGMNLQHLCMRYVKNLIAQLAQSVVCTRHHSLDQRLCRWLLLSLDKQSGNLLDVTQEFIAHMLGVRREGITEAAGRLQAAGLLQYSRGRMTILNRPGLEARVCACYRLLKSQDEAPSGMVPALPQYRPRPNPAILRKRAEARLQQVPATLHNASLDSVRLLHELQVHEVELELHNEELRQAYAEVDSLREKYADLYNFSPVAYITVDRMGAIRQSNLAGAILLGLKRSEITRHRFGASVASAWVPTFNRFIEQALGTHVKCHCEVELVATEQRRPATVRIDAAADEKTGECWMVVSDITEAKYQEKVLKEQQANLNAVQQLGHIGIWTWNLQTQAQRWSDETYALYGRDTALPPIPYPEVPAYFTPASWAGLESVIEGCREHGYPFTCQAELVRADGTRR